MPFVDTIGPAFVAELLVARLITSSAALAVQVHVWVRSGQEEKLLSQVGEFNCNGSSLRDTAYTTCGILVYAQAASFMARLRMLDCFSDSVTINIFPVVCLAL
jgi:hypothetical protein